MCYRAITYVLKKPIELIGNCDTCLLPVLWLHDCQKL